MTEREKAVEFEETMQCNCDLDNWEPERSTGHSWVCRIHEAVQELVRTNKIECWNPKEVVSRKEPTNMSKSEEPRYYRLYYTIYDREAENDGPLVFTGAEAKVDEIVAALNALEVARDAFAEIVSTWDSAGTSHACDDGYKMRDIARDALAKIGGGK